MTDSLTPQQPKRPLIWPDVILDLQDLLHDIKSPIYIVGGAVRDAYLHRLIKDLDLAVPTDSISLARTIANRGKGDIFVMDAERGVARVLLTVPYTDHPLTVDIAQFRGDGLLADLQDRDFTLNAMAVDLHGDLSLLIDPLGGMVDVEDKRLRACSSHAIADDPIRALRAIRQSVQLGFRIEADTLRAIRRERENLTSVSWERIRDEFVSMLALPQPTRALRVADAVGLLQHIVPEVIPLHQLTMPEPHVFNGWEHTLQVVDQLTMILNIFSPNRSDSLTSSFGIGMLAMQIAPFRARLLAHANTHWPNNRPHSTVLMLAALLHECDASDATNRLTELRLSNGEKQRITTMVANHHRVPQMEDVSPLAIHRYWYQLGDAGIDVCLLALADYLGTVGVTVEQNRWLVLIDRVRILLDAYFNHYERVVVPPSLVDGDVLIAELVLKPSQLIGELLTLIREGQVTGDVRTVDDALNLARQHLSVQD